MATYGPQAATSHGGGQMVTADGKPEWKTAGVTIDWSTVTAVSGADVVLNDGTTIKVGAKYLRYGQPLNKITASGKFGPVDTSASDGRQTSGEGLTYVVNSTVLEATPGSDHPAVLGGGKVFAARLLVGGTNQITLANLRVAMPRLATVAD